MSLSELVPKPNAEAQRSAENAEKDKYEMNI